MPHMTDLNDPHGIDRVEKPEAHFGMDYRQLGRKTLPDTFVIDSIGYHLVHSMKHDFVAATGFYEDANGRRVVLKMGRTAHLSAFPCNGWAGFFAVVKCDSIKSCRTFRTYRRSSVRSAKRASCTIM